MVYDKIWSCPFIHALSIAASNTTSQHQSPVVATRVYKAVIHLCVSSQKSFTKLCSNFEETTGCTSNTKMKFDTTGGHVTGNPQRHTQLDNIGG